MIYNDSHNDKDLKRTISDLVGEEFRFRESIKMRGTGSPKLTITSCSSEIHKLITVNNTRLTCNIELRKKGIIIRFRSKLETYALPIPYYKLSMYKGEADTYSFYMNEHVVKVKADHPSVHKFVKKVTDLKADQGFTYVDDL